MQGADGRSKAIMLLRRAPELDRDAFRRRCLEALAATVWARVVASFTDVEPAEVGLDPATPEPEYDAVLETWHEAPGELASLEPLPGPLREITSEACGYVVREIVQRAGDPGARAGERSPGVKGIYPVTRRPGMDPEQFERHWREVHGPLALRHHAGMSRYVQNVVERPLTPGAPPCDGISVLHFPSFRDMRERFIDSAEGGRRIAADVARFVGSSLRLDTSEYLVRGQA